MVEVPEDKEALRGFLKTTSLFGALDASVADQVIAMLKPHRYAAGETVFAEGDKGHSVYLVRYGQCIVARHCEHGGPTARLLAMRPGDHFGVTAVIEMEPRPFSCIAERESLLYEMTNADLYALYKTDLKAYIIVLQNISRELCRRLRKAAVRIAALEDSLRLEHEHHK